MLKTSIDRFDGSVDGTVISLGHSINRAAKNMGIDEAMLRLSDEKNTFFIRTYEFEKNTIILSASDSVKNVIRYDDLDLTRRITAGKPIYIDENVLSYSITGPMHNSEKVNPGVIHKIYGSMIAKAIEITLNADIKLELGNAYSIRFNGMPLVGNGQHIAQGHSFMYHGVIAVGPWDFKKISSSLRLLESDSQALRMLPSISTMNGSNVNIDQYKKRLSNNIISTIKSFFKNSKSASMADMGIENLSNLIAKEKYTNKNWILRDDIALREDSRFCLLYEG